MRAQPFDNDCTDHRRNERGPDGPDLGQQPDGHARERKVAETVAEQRHALLDEERADERPARADDETGDQRELHVLAVERPGERKCGNPRCDVHDKSSSQRGRSSSWTPR